MSTIEKKIKDIKTPVILKIQSERFKFLNSVFNINKNKTNNQQMERAYSGIVEIFDINSLSPKEKKYQFDSKCKKDAIGVSIK